ncbi:MAG: metal-dependent hydrolase [Planctomycetia bacterium]|nr:metal-dependent hydrolase [Planctomycetia bacterium]
MADFKTHITTSTALGVGYAAVAYTYFKLPAPPCLLAGALCSVSGMLPDLDSDSGIPLRESLAFAAACVPMLLTSRFEAQGWSTETMVLAGAGMYIAVRFGLGTLLKKYTVHRGMFHSIPAALIAGEVAFLLCATGDIYLRAFKACAVLVGFFSHLILDEIWSIRFKGGIGLKSSSGTAMKLWGDSAWGNLSCYVKLILLGVVVLNDPVWSTVSPRGQELHSVASAIVKEIEQKTNLRLPNDGPAQPTGTTTQPTQSSPTQTQQPSPALQQAYALQQQQAYQQQLYQQQVAAQQQAYQAAYQQAAYQQSYYGQSGYSPATYPQQQSQSYQPATQTYPQQYQQPYYPNATVPAYQAQPNYGQQPRAGYPMTRRY